MKNNNVTLVTLLSAFSIIVAVNSLHSIYAQENSTEHVPKFFAIQHAQSGSITEINETAYSLELNDVSDKTILFSDRPNRIVSFVSTSGYISNWTSGTNNFEVDHPNAVVVVDLMEGKQDITIIELFSPIYNSNNKTLKYDITPDNATSIDLPSEFGQISLIIDDTGGQYSFTGINTNISPQW